MKMRSPDHMHPPSGRELDIHMQQRAGFHVLACMLTVFVFPLLLIYTYRAVRALLRSPAASVPEGNGTLRLKQRESAIESASGSSTVRRHIFLPDTETDACAAVMHVRESRDPGELERSSTYDACVLPIDIGCAESASPASSSSQRNEARVQMCETDDQFILDDSGSFYGEACMCLREVLLDVVNGNTIQMR